LRAENFKSQEKPNFTLAGVTYRDEAEALIQEGNRNGACKAYNNAAEMFESAAKEMEGTEPLKPGGKKHLLMSATHLRMMTIRMHKASADLSYDLGALENSHASYNKGADVSIQVSNSLFELNGHTPPDKYCNIAVDLRLKAKDVAARVVERKVGLGNAQIAWSGQGYDPYNDAPPV
jgi:hypothetical protein